MTGSEKMKRRILIADRDPYAQKLLFSVLTANGFDVITADGADTGYALLSSECPDIMIIDVNDKKALSVIGTAREWTQLPIIAAALSPTDSVKTATLEAGADIFIEKPFSVSEVIAYLKVCVRRITESEALRGMKTHGAYKHGGLTVDIDGGCVYVNEKPVHLTVNELKILILLCRYSGRVLSYDFIMNSVWGPMGKSNRGLLRVNVTNIRRKIESDAGNPVYLITENGIGYRMVSE